MWQGGRANRPIASQFVNQPGANQQMSKKSRNSKSLVHVSLLLFGVYSSWFSYLHKITK